MMKRNDGFTLVELLVTIAIGTLVTAAASALLITGLRINARSNKLAVEQDATRMLLEVMAEIAAEEGNRVEPNGETWILWGTDGDKLASYNGTSILLRGTELLDNVEKSMIDPDYANQLVTISVTIDGREYETTIYCRFLNVTLAPEGGDAALCSREEYREMLTYALESGENSPAVTEFLTILASQQGSRGQILNEAGEATGEYFSEWYIGGYEDNPGWDAATPWCACYLSWAADRCEGLWEAPRYANVDTWWADAVTGKTWSVTDPAPGDIVFFDWIVDDTQNPQHVGAVLAVVDGWVYTIEGNSGNRVALCRYEAADPCILGYARPDWK